MQRLISNRGLEQAISKNFSPTDTEKLFKKNKKRLGKDWVYQNKKISYSQNQEGFRHGEFASTDWKNSIVVLGCSNVYGIGLANEDTVCSQLEKLLNIPTVNLGIAGSAIDVSSWNSLILHEHYPHPKAIVQIWTGPHRYSNISKPGFICCYLPQSPGYCARHNWQGTSEFYMMADRALWRNKTLYCEGSFFSDHAGITPFKNVDHARDLAHPGIKTNAAAAEKIAEDLIQRGIKIS